MNVNIRTRILSWFWALIQIGVGVIILVALISFSPYDATFDTASGLGVRHNRLGGFGAELANVLLQFLGWVSYGLGVLGLLLGVKDLQSGPTLAAHKYRFLIRVWRIGLFLGIVSGMTIVFAALPIPQNWPMANGLGGMVGEYLFERFRAFFETLHIPMAGVWAVALGGLISAICILQRLGIAGQDILDIWYGGHVFWTHMLRIWRMVSGFLSRLTGKALPQKPVSAPPRPKKRTRTKASPKGPVTHTSKPVKKPAKAVRLQKNAEVGFSLPTLNLLRKPPLRANIVDEGRLQQSAEKLSQIMTEYGIEGKMGDVRPGPVVTLFEFSPAPGVKSTRVIGLASDIARNMTTTSARIAVVPGRNAMGIELPNRRRETVWLYDMLNSEVYRQSKAVLPLVLGEDIGGAPYIADLARMPHLLVAGTTGSGKSVSVNAMILSLMYKLTPQQCKFIMIDPKMLELSVYDHTPYLLTPVVTEPKKAVVALKWTVREMESRYRKMAKMGVRNMAGYNEKITRALAKSEVLTEDIHLGYDETSGAPLHEKRELPMQLMPFIVVIIDEMADLMMVARKDIEGSVQRLAQMARAAGIHIIMATQRPSTDVITGTIKANFPTRVSFRVGSAIDSRTIINENGAEQLLGNGDMLFLGTGRPRRLHGPFVSDGEIEQVTRFIRAQGSPTYVEDVTVEPDNGADLTAGSTDEAPGSLFDQAVEIVARDRKASTSYIQRKLSIGYNRAANLVERMEEEGMIGPSGSGGAREIFLPDKQGR